MADQASVVTDAPGEALAKARLASLNGNRECPICRHSDWDMGSTPVGPTELLVAPFRGYPVYVFFCTTCGYVQQFLREVLDGHEPADEDTSRGE